MTSRRMRRGKRRCWLIRNVLGDVRRPLATDGRHRCCDVRCFLDDEKRHRNENDHLWVDCSWCATLSHSAVRNERRRRRALSLVFAGPLQWYGCPCAIQWIPSSAEECRLSARSFVRSLFRRKNSSGRITWGPGTPIRLFFLFFYLNPLSGLFWGENPLFFFWQQRIESSFFPLFIQTIGGMPGKAWPCSNFYVSISRFTSLETMAIPRPVPRSIRNQKPHPDMKAELQRFQSIDSTDWVSAARH